MRLRLPKLPEEAGSFIDIGGGGLERVGPGGCPRHAVRARPGGDGGPFGNLDAAPAPCPHGAWQWRSEELG